MLALFGRSSRSRMALLGISAVVLGVLFVGAGLLRPGSTKSAAGPEAAQSAKTFEVALDDSRKVTGFVESYGQRVKETEKELAKKDGELLILKGELQKHGKAMEAVLRELEGIRAREIQTARPLVAGAPAPGADPFGISEDAPPPGPAAVHLPRIEKITLPAGRAQAALLSRKDEVRLPAGSFAEATLLTGVYAPTQGSAQPVHLRVDLTFIGPNRSRIPIQGAFLIGKAVGEANSVRAIVQLDKLSFVREGGETVEIPVNGYVADQDGVMGLRGIYDWRIHEAASLAAVTGGLAAGADAAAAQESVTQLTPLGGATQIVTGNLGKYTLAKGASRAADEVGKILTRRLDELIPAVYVENGRKLTVVLLDGVTLLGLPLQELSHETSRNPYAGLDLDR